MRMRYELVIFWLVFTLLFVWLLNSNHYLTYEQNSILFFIGIVLIAIGFVRTTIR